MSAAVAKGQQWDVECRIRRASDNCIRWIEVRARPDGGGAPATRLVGVVADITARKQAEEALVASHATLEAQVTERTKSLGESNAQLDAFAYTVSHDLRAPLRAMEGFARILLEDFAPGLGPDGERFAGRIVGAAKRMEILIDDLLAFSRVQRAEINFQALDPGRAVRRSADELRKASVDQTPIVVEIVSPFSPKVRGD